MTKFCKLLIALVFLDLLCACAPTNSYVEPSSSIQGISTIRGSSERKSLSEWKSAEVTFVDGKSVGIEWSNLSKINLMPGDHNIIVNTSFNAGYGSGPYSAVIQIPLKVAAFQHYTVKTDVKGDKMLGWVVDSHDTVVSEIISKDYQLMPQGY